MSHPTMGAWIEISYLYDWRCFIQRRTPRWVRGLKYLNAGGGTGTEVSHPTMGAWIEIFPKAN